MRAARHIEGLIPLSRAALASALAMGRGSGAFTAAVDATMGNGHDTLFLAESIGENGHVWAFDVQENAHIAARERFAAQGPSLRERVTFRLAGHETMASALPPRAHGRVWATTFNLGFLPGSDKRIVTRPETTLAALSAVTGMMAIGGVLSVHCYLGHAGGEEEGQAVAAWCANLPWAAWRVAEYGFANKRQNRELLLLAERIA